MNPRIALLMLALGIPGAVAANNAPASVKPVFSHPVAAVQAIKTKRFVANPALERAWVEIDLYYPLRESSDTYRVAVPGLRFDPVSSSIVLHVEGKKVTCATVSKKGRWLFRHDRVLPTGECELSRRYIKKAMDNGFTVDEVEHVEVLLQPMPRAAGPVAGQS